MLSDNIKNIKDSEIMASLLKSRAEMYKDLPEGEWASFYSQYGRHMTKEELELVKWFERKDATDDEPKSTRRFWGKYRTVVDCIENPSDNDKDFICQMKKAFYGIYRHIVDNAETDKQISDVVESIIREANVFLWCVQLETFRGADCHLCMDFIKNVRRLVNELVMLDKADDAWKHTISEVGRSVQDSWLDTPPWDIDCQQFVLEMFADECESRGINKHFIELWISRNEEKFYEELGDAVAEIELLNENETDRLEED